MPELTWDFDTNQVIRVLRGTRITEVIMGSFRKDGDSYSFEEEPSTPGGAALNHNGAISEISKIALSDGRWLPEVAPAAARGAAAG